MLTREDIERIIENVLYDLTLESETCFEDPDYTLVLLKYKNRAITSTLFRTSGTTDN